MKITKDIESKIIEIYTTQADDGTWIGATTIAKMFGISKTSVQNVLKANDVKTRSAKESHSGGKRCKPIKNTPTTSAPLCKCGCGNAATWNTRKNKWNVYYPGHYRNNKKYKNKDWLFTEYSTKKRTANDIANEYSVSSSTIIKFLRKFDIPVRKQSESLSFSGAVRGKKNPAWKGGISKVRYAYNWRFIRKAIKNRDQWTCQSCGEKRKRWDCDLHVHHIDGDKFNNSFDNLVSLCVKCHRKIHSKSV